MSNRKKRRLEYFLAEKGQHETKKIAKKIRRQKRASRSKRVRRKDWQPLDAEEWEELSHPQFEPMQKPDQQITASPEPAEAVTEGIIVEASSGLYRVDIGEGRRLLCHMRGAVQAVQAEFTNPAAVGDRVKVAETEAERGAITTILPRRSTLSRPVGHVRQLIAANIDQILIVASWRDPHLWPELIDRYLITAARAAGNKLSATICINKIDLAEDLADCRAELQPYLDLHYPVIFTSALSGRGIPELRQNLQGQTTVLAGLSGVGKSSLLNAIQPGLQLRVGRVNQERGQGRHTTTQAVWHNLALGGAVVDTPGIREFGLSGLPPAELIHFYPEIIAFAPRCRFLNCSHIHEPDCAVKTAVEAGRIASSRYHNYRQIYTELAAT